jgi:glycerol-3-phosphate dehydrogenase
VHRRLTRAEALDRVPTLRADRLASAYLYFDAHADDARLTLAIARTAADHGAAVANHASVTGILKTATGRAAGVRVCADDDEFDVRAGVVVNAAGVWADDVRALDEGKHPRSTRPAKGVHLTVLWEKVRNDVAIVLPAPDGRNVFVVPWEGRTYIGTTDDDYDGELDNPQCTVADVAYLLGAVNQAVAEPLTEADVVATWAGLRPLLARADTEKTADLSRRHGIRVSGSGVVTITGGKLTTYRAMAKDTIDQVDQVLDGRHRRCRTKRLPLIGARGYREPRPGTSAIGVHLAHRYGTHASVVRALIETDPTLAEPLVPGLPYLRAEAVYALRHEMARTLDDVLDRRTRARSLDRDAVSAAAPDVARLVARELGWDETAVARAIAAYQTALAAETAHATDAAATGGHAIA